MPVAPPTSGGRSVPAGSPSLRGRAPRSVALLPLCPAPLRIPRCPSLRSPPPLAVPPSLRCRSAPRPALCCALVCASLAAPVIRGVVRACRHPTNLRGAPVFPHCRAVYMFKRGLLAPLLGAPPITGAFGRGGVPRPQSLGGPPLPFSLHPAPFGRAPPRWSGLRESGCRATPSAFLSAAAGTQNGALSLSLWVPLLVPLRPLRVRRAILVSRSRTDKAIFQNSQHCWNLFSPPRPYSNNVGNFKKPTAKK